MLVWSIDGVRLHEQPCEGPCFNLAFSPDGRRLAGVDREQLIVWDVPTGQEVLLVRGAGPRPGDGGFNPALTWDAQGRQLAAGNWDGSVSIWDAAPREGEGDRAARWASARRGRPAGRWRRPRRLSGRVVRLPSPSNWSGSCATLAPDFKSRLRRGDLLLRRGATEKARQEYAAVFEAGDPLTSSPWLRLLSRFTPDGGR